MPGSADTRELVILHLYPREMNIYGDWGNVLALKRRAERHGYTVTVATLDPGDPIPTDTDIIVGGGGQDSGQFKVEADLARIAHDLKDRADHGTPMLMICGLYQLFGHSFATSDGATLTGIGLLDVRTVAGNKRLIGNITTTTDFGTVIGYENHSGQTFLGPEARPFGTVIMGAGNNGTDKTEGARYKNVYGSYLHGSLLPKNPAFADELIRQAAIKRYGSFEPLPIDDSLVNKARDAALRRPR